MKKILVALFFILGLFLVMSPIQNVKAAQIVETENYHYKDLTVIPGGGSHYSSAYGRTYKQITIPTGKKLVKNGYTETYVKSKGIYVSKYRFTAKYVFK